VDRCRSEVNLIESTIMAGEKVGTAFSWHEKVGKQRFHLQLMAVMSKQIVSFC